MALVSSADRGAACPKRCVDCWWVRCSLMHGGCDTPLTVTLSSSCVRGHQALHQQLWGVAFTSRRLLSTLLATGTKPRTSSTRSHQSTTMCIQHVHHTHVQHTQVIRAIRAHSAHSTHGLTRTLHTHSGAYQQSGMMLCAMDAAMRGSSSSTGLPAPKRECVPIMKATTNSCARKSAIEQNLI